MAAGARSTRSPAHATSGPWRWRAPVSGRALRQPLPGRTRRAVENVREACRARLVEGAVLSDGRLLAESVAQLLVTYAKHPAEAEDILAAIDAVLGAGACELPLLVLLGPHGPLLLPVPRVDPSWAELACAHLAAGHEASLVDLWEADPSGLFAPDEGLAALAQALEPCGHDADPTALAAFTRWALADARRARARGVRGGSAYITIEEPRLRAAGLGAGIPAARDREPRARALRLGRWPSCGAPPAAGWHGLAVVGRYPRWAAAGGLPRRRLPRHRRAAGAPGVRGGRAPGPDTAREARGIEPQRRLRPVGYLPAGGGGHRVRGPRGADSGPPVPHAVAWYIRRLRPGYRTRPAALAAAEAVGVVVPLATRLWAATSGRVPPTRAARRPNCGPPTALSSLRAILQATRRPSLPGGPTARWVIVTSPL